jgi:hypothetical protein
LLDATLPRHQGVARCWIFGFLKGKKKPELELIQTQMAQKPMLRAEVHVRALRASQNGKGAEKSLIFVVLFAASF